MLEINSSNISNAFLPRSCIPSHGRGKIISMCVYTQMELALLDMQMELDLPE